MMSTNVAMKVVSNSLIVKIVTNTAVRRATDSLRRSC